MTKSLEITIRHDVGLHARPAAMFVKVANGFLSHITVKNISNESDSVDAKSILGILSSGVQMNDRIRITAEGEDEDEALAALRDLIEGDFIQPT
ncbi:MAG: HPr family phosphocarrier protein [Anaerolineales bacterium]